MDCPICFETIESNNINKVVTECGHTFHCSCLMKNTSYNGFGCPVCRSMMAQNNKELEDDAEDDESEEQDYEEEEKDLYDDESLLSFRLFHQRTNGIELEPEKHILVPNNDFILHMAQCLISRGYTYYDLLRFMILKSPFVTNEEDENEMPLPYTKVVGEIDNIFFCMMHDYQNRRGI